MHHKKRKLTFAEILSYSASARMSAMGWPAKKWIYKYVQNCTHRNNEREGNRNYPNGDLTKDDSTRPSTYVKTLTTKEKFQC